MDITLDEAAIYDYALSPGAVADHYAAASVSPYSDAVLADSPLAYWRLGDAGSSAADETGNGHTGSASSGVSFGSGSLLPADLGNTSVTLGDPDRITVAGFEKFGSGATGYSVEFWVTLNETPPVNAINLVGDGQSSGTDFYEMVYLVDGGEIRAHLQATDGTHGLDSATVLNVDQTYYVVTTWDQATGDATIYLDGVVEVTTNFGAALVPLHTANTVFLGTDIREASGMDITLDEAAIYDYALSPESVSDRFTLSFVPEPAGWLMLVAGGALLSVLYRRRIRAARVH